MRLEVPSTSKESHASRLLEAALELAFPTRCVGCDRPGTLLCDDCREGLAWIAQRWACPVCGAPYGWLVCTECGRDDPWEMRATTSALVFEGAARATVTLLKDAHELRLAPVMAAAIACALDEASAWPARDGAARHSDVDVDAICFVPATPAAYARRGFDHMELVSRELSTLVSIPLADVLARVDASDQRTLGRQGRADNARGTFRVVDDVGGMDLLLVDDVVTTGASMREAARTLLGRGASSVSAASFARVW